MSTNKIKLSNVTRIVNIETDSRMTIKELLESGKLHLENKFHVVHANDTGKALIALTVFKEDKETIEQSL